MRKMVSLQGQISKKKAFELKSHVYRSLAAYYNNQLWDGKDLAYVIDVFETYNHLFELNMEEALEVIKHTDLLIEEKCKFDFNKLFIGPYRLLASPYESTYLNHDRLLMRSETMSVRSFYEKANVQVDGKGRIPDDHIAFELEFVAFLSHQISQEQQEETNTLLLYEFLSEHLGKWVEKHVKLITSQAETEYCKAWARILILTVQHDLKEIQLRNEGE